MRSESKIYDVDRQYDKLQIPRGLKLLHTLRQCVASKLVNETEKHENAKNKNKKRLI